MNRTQWVDNAKGLAIILVVAAHVWRGLRDAELLNWTPAFELLDSAVYSFHMPAFFALAGLTACLSDKKGGNWIRPIIQLYAIYLLWSTLQTLLMFSLSRYTNGDIALRDIIMIPIKPNAQFWFLLILIVFRIVVNLVPEKVALVLAAILFVGASIFNRSEYIPFQLSHFFLFFMAGYYLASRQDKLPSAATLVKLAVAIATLLIFPLVLKRLGAFRYDSIFALPSAVLGTVAIYWCARSIEDTNVGRAFSVLGRYSLSIYILHIIVASGMRIALVRLGVTSDGYVLLAICTAAGLGLPILTYAAAERVGIEGLFTMRWDKTSALRSQSYPR